MNPPEGFNVALFNRSKTFMITIPNQWGDTPDWNQARAQLDKMIADDPQIPEQGYEVGPPVPNPSWGRPNDLRYNFTITWKISEAEQYHLIQEFIKTKNMAEFKKNTLNNRRLQRVERAVKNLAKMDPAGYEHLLKTMGLTREKARA